MAETSISEQSLEAIADAIHCCNGVPAGCREMKEFLRAQETFESFNSFGELFAALQWHRVTPTELQNYCAVCLKNRGWLGKKSNCQKLITVCALFGVVLNEGKIEKHPIDSTAKPRVVASRKPRHEAASLAPGGLRP